MKGTGEIPLNYDEALAALHAIPRRNKEENLNRMERLMAILSDPHKRLKLIHVAGTNGKGSISRMLEEVLSASGYRTGLFTSPYIFDFRERIQIDNVMILREEVVHYFEIVLKASETLTQEGWGMPSEFEFVTAMALLYFRDQDVDLAIIEVGIGGLYDATNVISPILSIISSINFDHTNLLGNTLESIARHKAGIIKGSPCVSSSQHPEVRKVLKEQAKTVSSELVFFSTRDMRFLEMEGTKQRVRYEFRHREPLTVTLSLLGIHQMINAGVVLHALEVLKNLGYRLITDEHVIKAMAMVRWPGRMEVIQEEPLVIIDGAHNMDGAINLRESMEFYFPGRKIILILGILKDKDVDAISQVLSRNTRKTICITPDYYRAMDARELMSLMDASVDLVQAASFPEAVDLALNAYERGDVILASGSLYTISDMERAFRGRLG